MLIEIPDTLMSDVLLDEDDAKEELITHVKIIYSLVMRLRNVYQTFDIIEARKLLVELPVWMCSDRNNLQQFLNMLEARNRKMILGY